MLRHFRVPAESVADNPMLPISQIPMLTERERRTLLIGRAGNGSDSYPVRETLTQLCKAQADD